MLQNIKISRKLPIAMVLLVVVALLILQHVATTIAQEGLVNAIESKLTTLTNTRKNSIAQYLESIREDLVSVALNRQTVAAIHEFKYTWDKLGGDQTKYLQNAYITNNPYPKGEKEKLDYATDGSSYSQTHAYHHTWFRAFMQQRAYYNIFLFDLRGNIIYTALKAPDYATNIYYGKWKDTHLREAYRAAKKRTAKAGDISFFDFKPYGPSDNAPASFISTPVYDGNKKIGVLIFQMPVERLNTMMNQYDGLSPKAQVSIVGQDHLMRTNARNSEENTILKKRIDGAAVSKALEGASGIEIVTHQDGEKYFSSYAPLDFQGIRWALSIEESVEEALLPIREIDRNIMFSEIIIAIIAIIAGLLLSRTISNPLQQVTDQLNALKEGNTDIDILHSEREDEIGQLARALVQFRENALERIKLREEQKQLEIQAERDKKTAMENIANSFQSRIQSIIQSVASAATQLTTTAQHVSENLSASTVKIDTSTQKADQTSINVQSVASAAEEMTATVGEISSQIQRSNGLVANSVDTVKTADDYAHALTIAAKKIQDVISLISDISGQINLLALNATIESARAGEAGKGFAVVAGEVKNLANQTDKSVQEIGKVIDEMNNASQDIVRALQEVTQSVNNISEASGSIASAVEEQSATTNEIAHNMQTAATSSISISTALKDVSKDSTESKASSEQMLAASQELSRQAETLDREVSEFLSEIRSS